MPISREIDLDAIAARAITQAEQIVQRDPFDYSRTTSYLGAISGLYSPGGRPGLTEELYNRLPEHARQASREVAKVSEKYLGAISLADGLSPALSEIRSHTMTDFDYDYFFVTAVQAHAASGGILVPRRIGWGKSPSQAVNPREHELRSVVRTAGEKVGSLLHGYVAVAPPTDNLVAIQRVNMRI